MKSSASRTVSTITLTEGAIASRRREVRAADVVDREHRQQVRAVRVRMEKVAADEEVGETAPQFEALGAPPGLAERPKIWQFGKRKAKERAS